MSEYTACRFRCNKNSDRVPQVFGQPQDPELPCLELTSDTLPASSVVKPVSLRGCETQRKVGLCLRNLGPTVDPALQLNPLNKH